MTTPRPARRRITPLSQLEARAQHRDQFAFWLIAAGLVAVIFAAYWPALSAGFFNFDDDVYVYNNPHVLGGLTLDSIKWAWTSHYLGYQIPLTWMSLMFDVNLFGTGPAGFHFTNILLHAINSVLLLIAMRRMLGSTWQAALIAILWAVHPLRVESVAWVTERKDELTGLFGFLSLNFYIWYTRDPSWRRYLAVIGTYCLALLSKPQLIGLLPALFWLLDYWPLCRMASLRSAFSRAFEKWPLVLVTAIAAAATLWSEHLEGPYQGDFPLDWSTRLANAAVAPLRYLIRLVRFDRLVPIYPLLPGWDPLWVEISLAVVLTISIFVLWQIRRRPWLAVGWAWFLVPLLPALTPPPGLLSVSIADRFTYLPSIGLLIMAVGSIERNWLDASEIRITGVIAAGLFVVVLAYCTRAQCYYWHDSETMWRHTIAATEKNWVAYHNLAVTLREERGLTDEAIDLFGKGTGINPYFAQGWEDEASTRVNRDNGPNDLMEAVRCAGRAIDIDPRFTKALFTRAKARILWMQSMRKMGTATNNSAITQAIQMAINDCQSALKIDKNLPAVESLLGVALVTQNKPDEAMAHFQRAVELNPSDEFSRKYREVLLSVGSRPHTRP